MLIVQRIASPDAFQPTLPARGATRKFAGVQFQPADFNPRSPHGERRAPATSGRPREPFQPTLPARGATYRRAWRRRVQAISTHAPRTGSDLSISQIYLTLWDFNPRSPHGERRRTYTTVEDIRYISTHAPRTGSDRPGHARFCRPDHFNPRSPHGERPTASVNAEIQFEFQPTLPARGATKMSTQLAAGTDDFNPRSPHGERP